MSRIGIMSDTHDNLPKVRNAIALFNRLKPDKVVHCGDVVAQFTLAEMEGLTMPVVAVFGNCDGDRQSLHRRAHELGFTLNPGPYRFQIGGKSIVVTHEPLSTVPDCDFYLHGHTHKLKHEPGRPAVINPGEACGYLFGRATVAMLDTDSGAVEFHDI
jgi:putative phosphoesterase